MSQVFAHIPGQVDNHDSFEGAPLDADGAANAERFVDNALFGLLGDLDAKLLIFIGRTVLFALECASLGFAPIFVNDGDSKFGFLHELNNLYF